jgi:hypothetical protein
VVGGFPRPHRERIIERNLLFIDQRTNTMLGKLFGVSTVALVIAAGSLLSTGSVSAGSSQPQRSEAVRFAMDNVDENGGMQSPETEGQGASAGQGSNGCGGGVSDPKSGGMTDK